MAHAQHLRAVPVFSELDDDALELILETGTEVEVTTGHVLAEGGQAGSGLFVIEDGQVTVELPGKSITLGPGEFFGEMSLLTEAPRVARVRATAPTRCLAIGRADFERVLEKEPKLAVAMLRALARRLAEQETH
jgi:CRP-like cAMP-binding protein